MEYSTRIIVSRSKLVRGYRCELTLSVASMGHSRQLDGQFVLAVSWEREKMGEEREIRLRSNIPSIVQRRPFLRVPAVKAKEMHDFCLKLAKGHPNGKIMVFLVGLFEFSP